jgi:hypothetical protein
MLPEITAILILATLVESLVEYLIHPLVKLPAATGGKPPAARPIAGEPAVTWRDLLLRYVAAAVGILLCWIYNADLRAVAGLAMVGLVSPWPWVGNIVTGLIIGRGANFVHDFASRWLAPNS